MRIAIVNDLRMCCEALRRVVRSAPGHEVAWTAADGAEAIERAQQDRPDLILMDLIMPRVDGVEATRQIMQKAPCPILVVTSSVSGNIGKVYEAMGHGALDAIDTPTLDPTSGNLSGAAPLLSKIACIARLVAAPAARLGGIGACRPTTTTAPPPTARPTYADVPPLILFGCSTGGPRVLAQILAALPTKLPAAIVVAQHVDAAFAPGLVRWLREQSKLPVDLVEPGAAPAPGRVLVAQTNDHVVIGTDGRLRYSVEPRDQPYRPSVDVLFTCAATNWPRPGIAVILTGMGRDGAAGLLALRRAGWHTIAQEQTSCTIYGMPRAAVELGAAVKVLAPEAIASEIAAKFRHCRT